MSLAINPQLCPIQYQAKWPKKLDPSLKGLSSKVANFVWNFISVIIFPIGLVRLADGWQKNRVLRIVVPGAFDRPRIRTIWDLVKTAFRFLWNGDNFKASLDSEGKALLKKYDGRPLTLNAPDNVKLDGAFFPGKIKDKAIIYAFGNDMQWENDSGHFQCLKRLNTSLLMVNPRGVGKSEGPRTEEGYALDIYAAYDFLINEQKIDPNDILLVGFSMGGANGTNGAALVQEEYPDKEIKSININSFSDLETVALSFLQGNGIFRSIARLAVKALRLNITPRNSWDKLKGEKAIFFSPFDNVIRKPASLYRTFKNNPNYNSFKNTTDYKKFKNCSLYKELKSTSRYKSSKNSSYSKVFKNNPDDKTTFVQLYGDHNNTSSHTVLKLQTTAQKMLKLS